MVAHQEYDQIDFLAVEAKTLGDFRGQARAALMMVMAVALADVVEKQGEEHQRQAIELARNLGEQRSRILELTTTQAFELADRDQRMPIDGIDMVEVVQHARVQIPELRNYRAEHAGQMHRLERLRDALASRQNFHQRRADARIPAYLVVDQHQAVTHQL